jgi:alpha-beta hydrolase superfamily lysophospholipase
MLRRSLRWVRARRRRTAAALVLTALFSLNLLAYRHAYAMTHYSPAGERPTLPEDLTGWRKVRTLLGGVSYPRPVNAVSPCQLGPGCTTHRFPSSDGIELEAWHLPPAGPDRGTVVLFHGYTSCKSRLVPEALAFRAMGFGVLLVDFRGSGGSTGDSTTIGMAEADDVAAAYDYAKAHWPGPVVLYGRSMGSVAILRAVSVHGIEPSAVVIECPFDTLAHAVDNRFAATRLPSVPLAQLMVFWGGLEHGFNAFSHDARVYARAVRCPALQLHGECDVRVTLEQARAVYANLEGPRQFELFPDTGHEACSSHDPARWRRVVGRFLDGAVPGRT